MEDNLLNETVRTVLMDDEKSNISVGVSSVIGKRSEQQDTVRADDEYALTEYGKFIAVLCDGMGGLSGGKKASELCATLTKDLFHSEQNKYDVNTFYRSVITECDRRVSQLRDERGEPMRAGTTFASVVIQDDKLYWASVGDSHIYIIRNKRIGLIVNEHNYERELEEKVKKGEITRVEADNHPKKEALTSYIGMSGVKYIDLNAQPYELWDGDYVILCSDGLYRTVSDEEIRAIVCGIGDAEDAAVCLTDYAMQAGKRFQDNTSVVVIQYHDSRYL